jgi:ParB family chromosome partitioning protein
MNNTIDEILDVPLDQIDIFTAQAREDFDDAKLDQLANDLKVNGQLQPGVAWFDPGRNRFVLVCGERRLRASQLAGRDSMSVKVIRGQLSPGQMLQMNLAENIMRASLNPIERAKGFRRLMQLEDLSLTEVSARMSISIATVSRDLDLLDLPESLQSKVATGELPASVAGLLGRLDDNGLRHILAERYEAGALTRDGVAKRVKELARPKGGAAKPQRLAVKLSGLSISVAGKPDKLTLDTLLSVLGRMAKEARSLKDAGTTDVNALAQALKAS